MVQLWDGVGSAGISGFELTDVRMAVAEYQGAAAILTEAPRTKTDDNFLSFRGFTTPQPW